MPGMYQQDSGVGTIVGASAGEGSIRANLHPADSEAGMGLLLAAVAFGILVVTIGRSTTGVGQKVIVVGQFVLVVIAASAVGQYAARTWALRHPDNRIAAGITVAI